MKSNVITFKKGENKIEELLIETEKSAVYNGLNNKESLRLRLLSEEIAGVLRELVDTFDGECWIENEGKSFKINFAVQADSMDDETKKKLISLSTSGKNELAKGFMGKIRSIIQYFAVSSEMAMDSYGFYVNPMDCYSMHTKAELPVWSLDKYKADVKNKKEWDELEKSIVANLADDVTVGVMGRKITVSVAKAF